jgi:hypothetical protein
MKSKNLLKIFFSITALILLTFYVQINANSNSETNLNGSSSETMNASVYTCPMHPDVISDAPGQCPKCGMDLVLKTDDTQKSNTAKCENMDNCKDKGCNMEKCKGNSGGCSENCSMMKDHKDMDMNENHTHDKMDHKKCKSNDNSGCMGH